VVYGVGDAPHWDQNSRVNTFLHVNNAAGHPRLGVLLCVNGTGILNSWLRKMLGGAGPLSYEQMNEEGAATPIGADGLVVLPFGNGAERTLNNRDLGAIVQGLSLVRHTRGHLCRAAQEGIAFALRYGMEIMSEMGVTASRVRAGRANMFLSPLFARAFADVSGATVELFETDGAQGAARAAGLGAGVFAAPAEAFVGLKAVQQIEPDPATVPAYADAYGRWQRALEKALGS